MKSGKCQFRLWLFQWKLSVTRLKSVEPCQEGKYGKYSNSVLTTEVPNLPTSFCPSQSTNANWIHPTTAHQRGIWKSISSLSAHSQSSSSTPNSHKKPPLFFPSLTSQGLNRAYPRNADLPASWGMNTGLSEELQIPSYALHCLIGAFALARGGLWY